MNSRIEQNTKLANMNEHNRRVTMAVSVMAYGICAVLFQGTTRLQLSHTKGWAMLARLESLGGE